MIFPQSYIGEKLELNNAIVDHNRLVHATGATISVSDNFILANLADHSFAKWCEALLSRLFAAILLIITSPVLLVTALYLKLFRGERVFHAHTVVRLPVRGKDSPLETVRLWDFRADNSLQPACHGARGLFRYAIPSLMNVTMGRMRFVGVSPRTPEQIQELSPEWRDMYLRNHAGIVTESYANYGWCVTDDELFAADAFYTVTCNPKHNMKLMGRCVCRFFKRMVHI